jgi:hypothetical protein
MEIVQYALVKNTTFSPSLAHWMNKNMKSFQASRKKRARKRNP